MLTTTTCIVVVNLVLFDQAPHLYSVGFLFYLSLFTDDVFHCGFLFYFGIFCWFICFVFVFVYCCCLFCLILGFLFTEFFIFNILFTSLFVVVLSNLNFLVTFSSTILFHLYCWLLIAFWRSWVNCITSLIENLF